MESVSKASFGLNETLRIVMPGYYAFAVLWLYSAALYPNLWEKGLPDAFLSLLIGLVIGFILYSFNYPNKRSEYNQGQPSEHLRRRSIELAQDSTKNIKPLTGDEHIRIYLYILNNYLPQTFHEVVMVRGALYYCVTYVWVISRAFGILGFFTLIFGCLRLLCGEQTFSVASFVVQLSVRKIMFLALFSIVQIAFWLLLTRPNRTDRSLALIYTDQIEWLKLNDILVTYLIEHRTDPRVYEFFKSIPPPTGGRAGNQP